VSVLPSSLQNLIEELGRLPGIGPRTAERYAYFLLRQDPSQARKLASSVEKLHDGVGYCKVTFALVDKSQDLSPLYTDPERDKTLIAVVADPFDIVAIENTRQFKGTYHVLGGLVSPTDGIGPEQLHIRKLIEQIKKDEVKENIQTTNASV